MLHFEVRNVGYKLIEMLRYKAQLRGIKVIITEESCTSQSSCLDRDDLPT
ncbi:hypothetical protein [Okeania sp. SIO1I7]|nr:hypothetical protein [Okeania sp. SIO1I7]